MHATAFSPVQRAAIEALRKEITRRVRRNVVAEYGATECGDLHDVALFVESLPEGSWGRPGTLVSILTGPGIKGTGFAIMGADGSQIANGIDLDQAVKAAAFAGVRQYRELVH